MIERGAGLRERKKAKLRQTILNKAIELIRINGLDGLRVADLVDALEISQPTFFRYFPTKDALIHAAARQMGRSTCEWLEQRHFTDAALARPVRDSLQAFSRDLADVAQSERRVIAVLIRAGLGSPWRRKPRDTDPAADWKRSEYPLVVDTILLAAQERGEVRKDQTAEELGDLYVGVLAQIILEWADDELANLDLHRRVERAVGTLLEGMAAQPQS